MAALFLTEDDVRELVDMEAAVEVIEELFRQWGAGEAANTPRVRTSSPGITLHSMAGAAAYLGVVGWKQYSTTRGSALFHVGLYDSVRGDMLALIEANYLGQLRTGAASGVATEFMARPDAQYVGLFGTGLQARTQLKAVCTVRRIEQVAVYSRDPDRRAKFADEMTEYCATKVVPVRSPEEAAAEKDIVITATTSRTPVFDGRCLSDGTHLNVVGSNYPIKTEIDVATVRRADSIVCDSIEQCRIEAGDFVEAIESGVTDWRLMHELAEVVTGRETGRAHPEQVTLFKSVGLAIEDVALGAHVLRKARDQGLGRPLPF
ncbi:MAG: ornithine cyclodeaminase family protein [Planctomycetaceae bacterium]